MISESTLHSMAGALDIIDVGVNRLVAALKVNGKGEPWQPALVAELESFEQRVYQIGLDLRKLGYGVSPRECRLVEHRLGGEPVEENPLAAKGGRGY